MPATFVFVTGFFAAIVLALKRLTAFAMDADARADALTTTLAEPVANVTVFVALVVDVVATVTGFGSDVEVEVVVEAELEVDVDVDVEAEDTTVGVTVVGVESTTSVEIFGSVDAVPTGSPVLVSPVGGNAKSSVGSATAKAWRTNGFTDADMNC